MADITIAILQIASPFILLGLLLMWIYRLSKDMKLMTRRWGNYLTDNEALWRRIREGEDGIYKKINDIEEHIEEMDDAIVELLHGAEDLIRANKTKPKTK